MNDEQLSIFFDGQCPLCVKEMRNLKKRDRSKRLNLIDINRADFEQQYPEIPRQQAMQKLHGYWFTNQQKHLLVGLDVTYHAWRLVGKGWLIRPLRWPGIRIVADKLYLLFARHRFGLSRLLTGKSRCSECSID